MPGSEIAAEQAKCWPSMLACKKFTMYLWRASHLQLSTKPTNYLAINDKVTAADMWHLEVSIRFIEKQKQYAGIK
jgi:hypothetical protein